jgi:hypothetical protein
MIDTDIKMEYIDLMKVDQKDIYFWLFLLDKFVVWMLTKKTYISDCSFLIGLLHKDGMMPVDQK